MINHWKFISLGPTCISASLIKGMGLKLESYPLDWAQSGSEIAKELFRLDETAFFWRHIHKPTQLLEQVIDNRILKKDELPTHGIKPIKSLFGYSWFYNPHSEINEHDNSYYRRCLTRFKQLIGNHTQDVCCIISDQPDLASYDYLNISSDQLIDFYNEINQYCECRLKIAVVRIKKTDSTYAKVLDKSILNNKIWLIEIFIPKVLYGCSPYESQICSLLLKQFFGRFT